MAKTMTPSASSPITKGQIGKLYDLLADALVKSGLPAKETQEVLETQGISLAAELVAVIRKRVEALSNMIVRRVKGDQSRAPQEVLKATGRKQYVDDSVVASMLHGEGDEVDVVFFKPDLSDRGGYISDDDLEKEFELRGLKPADPYSVAAVNEADSAFADEKPHGTHWKDADGKWCYATFDRWLGGRSVDVYRGDDDWHDGWWFAGLRK